MDYAHIWLDPMFKDRRIRMQSGVLRAAQYRFSLGLFVLVVHL